MANALRAQRRYDAALSHYLRIVQSGRSDRQALAARLAAASLLLDHQNDAQRAIHLLRPIASSSAAMPEAVFLFGRALQAAGYRVDAVRALQRFTQSYPDHPLRQSALERLERLNGASP